MKRYGQHDGGAMAATILAWIALLCLSLWAAAPQAGGPEQTTAFGGKVDGAPWWATTLIIAMPGAIAVLLTIASGVMVKRVNRSLVQNQLSVLASIKWTLAFGALWGPLVSWGFGEMVYALTAVATTWKLIVVAPFVTGVVSMIAYDALRWYTHSRYPGIYALLSVKHRKEAGHAVGNDDDGDLTHYAAQDKADDDPTPTPRN